MLPDVLPHLICPLCSSPLEHRDTALACQARHTFDVARQGYVNLLPGDARPGGDSVEMVRSRSRFLDAGHFSPLTAAVVDAVPAPSGLVVDVGAGTGHHLAAVLDHAPAASGLAVDNSKHAARVAARCHPRAGAVVADVWRGLPVAAGSAELVLDVFSPRNGAEFHRVLRPHGWLVIVVPRADHLRELVSIMDMVRVDGRKDERLAAELSMFRVSARRHVSWTMTLSHTQAAALVLMGPSARHLSDPTVHTRLSTVEAPVRVTGSVDVLLFAPGH